MRILKSGSIISPHAKPLNRMGVNLTVPGGAPIGNTNGRKQRLFEQAFIREIKQRDLELGDGETLRRVAKKIIDLILKDGDISAFREARDTVDGKPVQAVNLGSDPDTPLEIRHKIG